MIGRRIRAWAATGVTVVMAGALALGGATAASAAGPGTVGWADFTLDGTARAYTGTMTLPGDFPQATFTSTSRQATIPSGSSTWQGTGTPVGAEYDSSRGRPYLNLRPAQDSPTPAAASVTTYTFERATPTRDWAFVLGDVDADQVTVSATGVDGAAVSPADLGFRSTYNYCRTATGGPSPSCDASGLRDVPSWDAEGGVLTGNAAAADTEGASAWFSPTVPLTTLTFTYQQRAGFPVYQTWFVTKTFTASGTVTNDGAAYPGAIVRVVDTDTGEVVGTTTTIGPDGTWSIPGLVSGTPYAVDVTAPDGSADLPARSFTVAGDDSPGLDFAFTGAVPPADTAPLTVTVVQADGTPVADRPVSVVVPGQTDPVASGTTGADGTVTFEGLDPAAEYDVVDEVTGVARGPITTAPGATITLAPTVEVTTSIVNPDGSAPVTGSTVDIVPVGETTPVASVETGAGGSFTAGGLTPGDRYEVILNEDVDSAVTITAPTTSGTIPPLQIAAPDAVAVEGTVVNADGTPAAGLPLQVIEADAAEPEPVATPTTDAAGVYRAEGLVPGTDYAVVLGGEVVGTFTAPFADGTVPTITLAAPPVVPPVTEPAPGPDPSVAPAPVVPSAGGPSTGGSGRPLAYTGSETGLPLALGAAALTLGLALVTGSAVVRRRAGRR